jgi:hypothetical protein
LAAAYLKNRENFVELEEGFQQKKKLCKGSKIKKKKKTKSDQNLGSMHQKWGAQHQNS